MSTTQHTFITASLAASALHVRFLNVGWGLRESWSDTYSITAFIFISEGLNSLLWPSFKKKGSLSKHYALKGLIHCLHHTSRPSENHRQSLSSLRKRKKTGWFPKVQKTV